MPQLALMFHTQLSWMDYLDFLVRLIVACLCGAVIGYERSKRFKEAGIRTHMIVALASALMMIISKYAFLDIAPDLYGTKGVDAARIAAQVVAGISFLGAGVIFKNGNSVKGLTTAAGIWATAGIGLTIGAGMYLLGVVATLLMWVVQFVLHKFRIGADIFINSRIGFTVKNDPEFRHKLDALFSEWKALITEIRVTSESDEYTKYEIDFKIHRAFTNSDFERIMEIGEIKDYSIIPLV